MPDKIKSTQYYNLAAILFCTLIFIISLILGYFHEIGTFGVETDFYGNYAIQAKNILSGKPYTYLHNPPGYPILLTVFSFLIGDFFVSAKILTSISTALLGLICYLIFKTLFTTRIALVSVIYLSIILIPYSFIASTDIVGAAFASIPILILISKDEINFRTYIIIGIACGVSYLIRADSIFVLVGTSSSILFILISNNWREKLIKTGVLLIGFILITSPWFIYNWKLNGSPLATTAYLQVGLYFYDEKGNENEPLIEKASEENSTSPYLLFINPAKILWKYFKNIPSRIELFVINSLPFPLYLFLGGGIFFFLLNLNRKRLAYFTIWLLGFMIFGLIAFLFRHYYSLVPFTSFLIVYSLFNEKFFINNGKSKYLIWGIAILLASFLLRDSFRKTKDFFDSEPKYLIEAAEFLKSRSSKDDLIITRKPHLGYLSNLKKTFLFENSTEDYLYKSKLLKARYIVYSDFDAKLWPGLKALSNPDSLPNDFHLIYQHKPTNTLIYEIK